MKHIDRVYLDNNIVSAFADDSHRLIQGEEVAQLILLCRSYGIEVTTSTVTREESDRGVSARQRHRREAFLRHVKEFVEPQINITEARDLCAKLRDKLSANRLLDDARHFLMAVRRGVEYFITYNTKDFNILEKAYAVPGSPLILEPGDFMKKLDAKRLPQIRKGRNPGRLTRSPTYPPLRGRIKQLVARNKRIQIRIAKKILKEIGYGF